MFNKWKHYPSAFHILFHKPTAPHKWADKDYKTNILLNSGNNWEFPTEEILKLEIPTRYLSGSKSRNNFENETH
ncbi:hypothetical protein MB09_09105 [Aequorivita vladivostokensis]|uniref:Uncharacterized protein n=1 Tax=Aequorivita vladivostokensis TaxID=171194 RepID=A0ABR5DHI3_9FLAO|nr:hypothetical protein MB09_09105 [Aequorivita vladivostokensis]